MCQHISTRPKNTTEEKITSYFVLVPVDFGSNICLVDPTGATATFEKRWKTRICDDTMSCRIPNDRDALTTGGT